MSKHEIRRMRVVRKLLGQQLAQRMGVSAPRISVLERDEQKGAVTLKMMARAAAALECDFVYALVPKTVTTAGAPGRQDSKPRLKLNQSESASTLDSRLQALLDTPSKS